MTSIIDPGQQSETERPKPGDRNALEWKYRSSPAVAAIHFLPICPESRDAEDLQGTYGTIDFFSNPKNPPSTTFARVKRYTIHNSHSPARNELEESAVNLESALN